MIYSCKLIVFTIISIAIIPIQSADIINTLLNQNDSINTFKKYFENSNLNQSASWFNSDFAATYYLIQKKYNIPYDLVIKIAKITKRIASLTEITTKKNLLFSIFYNSKIETDMLKNDKIAVTFCKTPSNNRYTDLITIYSNPKNLTVDNLDQNRFLIYHNTDIKTENWHSISLLFELLPEFIKSSL